METPPVSQLLVVGLVGSGPHRLNATTPLHGVMPVTLTTAWSRTVTDPLPIETSMTPLGGVL